MIVHDCLTAGYLLRLLHRDDYHKGHFDNLKTLTWTGAVSHGRFLEQFDWTIIKGERWSLNVVVEHEDIIVGSGVL